MPDESAIIGKVAVKVIPNTKAFKSKLQPELDTIERQLKDLQIGVVVEAKDVKEAAKKAQKDAEDEIKKINLKVDIFDADNLRDNMRRLQRELDNLKVEDLEVDVDKDSLLATQEIIEEALEESASLKLRIDRKNMRSVEKAIARLDKEIEALGEIDVSVKADRPTLERFRAELQAQVEEAASAAKDALEKAGRDAEIEAEIKLLVDNARKQMMIDDVQKSLNGIEFAPDVDEAKLAKTKREIEQVLLQIAESEQKVQVEIDPLARRKMELDIEAMRERLATLKASVAPEMHGPKTRLTELSLAFLTRTRKVLIEPEISKKALAGVATALSAIAGGRILTMKIEKVSDILMNLDKSVPKIAAVTTAVGGLAAYAVSATGNLLSLGDSLVSIGAAGLALPGLFAGIAVGVGLSAIALKDFKEQVPQITGHWEDMKAVVSENFWAKAQKPISDMVDNLLPKFIEQSAKTATELGIYWGNLATSISDAIGPRIQGMFADLNESIKTAAEGTDAIGNSLGILGSVGASYLPRLAQWFVDMTNRFSEFLTVAEQDGSLKKWIDNGIQALNDLGGVLHQTIRIFGGLADAAQKAGGSTLGTLRDALTGIADVVNSAPFQTELVGVFEAAFEAMDRIATIAGPAVKGALLALAQLFQQVVPIIGTTIGTLLRDIAAAISDPTLMGGIQKMVVGIQQAVENLTPVWEPLAEAIGLLAPVVGQLAAAFAQIIASSVKSFVPLLESILPPVSRLATVLSDGLVAVLEILEPIFVRVGDAAGAFLTEAIGPIQTVIEAIIPLFERFAPIIGDLIVRAFEALAPLMPPIAEAFKKISDILIDLAPAFEFLAGVLLDSVIGIFRGLVQVVTGAIDVIWGVWQFFAGLFTGDWKRMWEGIKSVGQGIWNLIKGAFNIFINLGILGIFRKGFTILKGLWTAGWTAIKTFAKKLWDDTGRAIDNGWSAITGFFSRGLATIKGWWSSAWSSIKGFFSNTWNSIRTGLSMYLDDIIGFFKGLPRRILTALGNLGRLLLTAGADLLRGMWSGIQSMAGWLKDKVVGFFSNLVPNWVKDALGIKSPSRVFAELGQWLPKGLAMGMVSAPAISSVKDAVQTMADAATVGWDETGKGMVDSLIDGMESRYGDLRQSLQGVAGEGVELGTMRAPSSVAARVSTAAEGAYAANSGSTRVLNYYAAPGSSISAEEDLFAASARARMVSW